VLSLFLVRNAQIVHSSSEGTRIHSKKGSRTARFFNLTKGIKPPLKGFGFGGGRAAVQPVIKELGIDFEKVISKRSKSMYFMIRRKVYAKVTQIQVFSPIVN
jgi:hypothetical protein